MRTAHRILFLIAAMTVMVAAFAVPAQAGAEGTLLSRINSSRASAGLAPLERYGGITDDARAQANRMSEEQRVFHNPNLAGSTNVWQGLGENVGVGTAAGELHDAFMASSGHRANILGDFNYVGIGATTDGNGLLWVSVIFMRAEPGLNGGGDTTTTAAPTTTQAPQSEPVPEPSTTTTTTTTKAPATPASTTPPTTTPASTTQPASASDQRSPAGVETSQEASGVAVMVGWGRPTAPFAD